MNCKVYDCFTFFNELELLDIRLAELYDVVDHFVLVESSLTFTGQPKKLHFADNKKRFESYLDKIIHVVVDDFPETDDPWVREYFQREAFRRALVYAEPDDLIFVTDADEIINHDAIARCKEIDGFCALEMNFYQYYMNLCGGIGTWTAAFGFRWKDSEKLPHFSRARWVRDEVQEAFKNRYYNITNAGWHFTHLGGIERIHQKILAYSHVNDPWPQAMLSPGALEKHILGGGAVGEMKSLSEFVPVDHSFPKTIFDRQTEYLKKGLLVDPYVALKGLQGEYRAVRQAYAVQVFDDQCTHPALGGITGKEFLDLSGVENYFEGKIFPKINTEGVLLSRGKTASQSSLSPWSRGTTLSEDASGALDGTVTGAGKFHTDFDVEPWWMVDLEQIYQIKEILVYNRIFPLLPGNDIALRSARLKIEVGLSQDAFVELVRKDNDQPFGGVDGKPLKVKINERVNARFVRICLLTQNYFHLDQVEVYGFKTAVAPAG